MKSRILSLFFACVVGTNIYGQGPMKIGNRASNQNFCLQNSISGVMTDALCIKGGSSFVGLGTASAARQFHILASGTAYQQLQTSTSGQYAGTEYVNPGKTWTVGVEGVADSFVITNSAGFGSSANYILEVDKTSGVSKFNNGGVSFATTGGTATPVVYFEEGTFSATFTQAGGYSQVATVKFTKINKQVTLEIPTFQGTATAAATINSGATDVPSRLRPAIESRNPAIVINAGGVSNTPGGLYVTTAGQIQVSSSLTGGTFTNGQTAGFGAGGTSAGSFSYKTP